MIGRAGVRHLLLDEVVGWRAAARAGLRRTRPWGHWTLEPLPGQPERVLLDDADADARCPTGIAIDECGRLLIIDAGMDQVVRVGGDCTPAEVLPFGGAGQAPRRLMAPRDLTVLAHGWVVVADTGNHRIQVFAPPLWALTQCWGATDARGRPVPGTGPLEFNRPWAVLTDGRDNLFIADRGNARVLKVSSDGRTRGALRRCIVEPTDLARSSAGHLAVIDLTGRTEPESGERAAAVVIFSDDCEVRAVLEDIPHARSAVFGPNGWLYLGDTRGRIHVLAPEEAGGREWRHVGVGVTGLDAVITELAPAPDGRLFAIVQARGDNDTQPLRPQLWLIDPEGAYAAPRENGPSPSGATGAAANLLPGTLVTEPLDSRIEQCHWHRVQLDADVPLGTSIEISSFTAEKAAPGADPTDPGFTGWQSCVRSAEQDPDCLVRSPPGRYLWLRFRLRSNGLASPRMRSAKVFFPRVGYMRFLPAVFQEDAESHAFLERFLAVFQTTFDGLGDRIDRLWQLFDPLSVHSADPKWLAAWLGLVIDPDWDETELRKMVARANRIHRVRGTTSGIEQAIRDYAGIGASIVEHYRIRSWGLLAHGAGQDSSSDADRGAPLDGSTRLWSRSFYQRLQLDTYAQLGKVRLVASPEPALEPLHWGAHRFSVLFEADPYHVDEQRTRVAAAVEREKPAHTTADLCPVFPRLRVGVQASVGMDARVGGIWPLVLNRVGTLGYDSFLGCSTAESALRLRGASVRPRAGLTTRLQ
ncbi:MAG: phage tail protein [Gemmatimonadota bacterium]|jgi:phage tail-like protein